MIDCNVNVFLILVPLLKIMRIQWFYVVKSMTFHIFVNSVEPTQDCFLGDNRFIKASVVLSVPFQRMNFNNKLHLSCGQ